MVGKGVETVSTPLTRSSLTPAYYDPPEGTLSGWLQKVAYLPHFFNPPAAHHIRSSATDIPHEMRVLLALCALTAASCSFLGGAGAPALRKARPALPVARFALMQAEAAAPSEDEKPMESAKAGGPLAKLKESLPPPKELKKVVPLGLMFFFILFSYTILRDTKDVRSALAVVG